MRIPRHPPDKRSLFSIIIKDKSHFRRILETPRSPTLNGRYLHWDKLIHLKPPDNLTHQDWWFGTKEARSALAKTIPLIDAKGHPFQFGLPDPTLEHLHYIDQNTGSHLEIAEAAIANAGTRDRYLVHSLVEEAITSSQLEGATTTRPVAKEMIRSGRKPRDRSEQMILNNYYAMQQIRSFKDESLSKDILLHLHRILTENTLDDPSAAGRFRYPNEKVGVYDLENQLLHDPPPAEELDQRISLMCDFANGKVPAYFIHPVIRAIILHFWLAYEHPFFDGNGRCARALFYWAMLRQGAWLCEFLSISQIIRKAPVKYGRAFLYVETDENDLTYFILYHLEVIRRAIRELQEYLVRKAESLSQTRQLIRASTSFNHRQLDLLNHALRHPDAEYTILSHKTTHNVAYQTARQDLIELKSKGLLEEHKGKGKTLLYYPAKELEHRIHTFK